MILRTMAVFYVASGVTGTIQTVATPQDFGGSDVNPVDFGNISINDQGTVAFEANTPTGGWGIFTGTDPVHDEIIGGYSPSFELNNAGQLAVALQSDVVRLDSTPIPMAVVSSTPAPGALVYTVAPRPPILRSPSPTPTTRPLWPPAT